jgi:hypothetical protein
MVIERMTEKQKRNRFLITASIKGVERAEAILKSRGFSSISAFAKAQLLGKSSGDKFLSRQPILPDTFIKICEGLEVKDWKELAELEPLLAQAEKVTQTQELQGSLAKDSREVGESFRRVTVLNPIGEVKIKLTFEGSIEAVTADVQRLIEACMKNAGGDTIRITDVRPGSIKVTVQGSPRDIAKLIDQINAGELTEVEGFPIQDCQILSEDFLADVGQHSNTEKWELIADIVNNPKIPRQLSGADLSDADLSNVILINADLTNADLSGSDLSNADLSAPLALSALLALLDRDTHDHLDLSDIHDYLDPSALPARLAHPNMLARLARLARLAHLYRLLLGSHRAVLALQDIDRSTNLEGADFTDTIVEGCQFGDGVGLSAVQKEYLKRRGGIFNEAPGDRSSVETPSPTRR